MAFPSTFRDAESIREPMSIYFRIARLPKAQRLPLISRNVGVSRLAALAQAIPIAWLHVGGRCRTLAQRRHHNARGRCLL